MHLLLLPLLGLPCRVTDTVHGLQPKAKLLPCTNDQTLTLQISALILHFAAYRDGVKRVREAKSAQNLPKFASGQRSMTDLLPASMGPTSSKFYPAGAADTALSQLEDSNCNSSSNKDADVVPKAEADRLAPAKGAVDGSGKAGEDSHSSNSAAPAPKAGCHDYTLTQLEHHKAPAMADGLAVDEDQDAQHTLQFKETPQEVRSCLGISGDACLPVC